MTAFDARELGVTLRIDDEAIKKLDEIQEDNIAAAQKNQKFSWR